jgi:alpha-galactosidase
MTTRRTFLEGAAFSALGLTGPAGIINLSRPSTPPPSPRGFLDLRRAPDRVFVQTETEYRALESAPGDRWTGSNGVLVGTTPGNESLKVSLNSPTVAVKRLHLRWHGRLTDVRLILGDAWERAYGDLEWRAWAPDRVLPWYFATSAGSVTHGYGVRTNCAAFCYWQVDLEGISLWADVRSGAVGVQLGPRTLEVCEVISRAGHEHESAFVAVHALCAALCPSPRLPAAPVFGSNDWYWAYGKNSAESVRTDAQHIVELSPAGGNRPFAVIDDGWQPERGADGKGAGTWDHGNEKFGDMAALASEIRRIGARPGIWIRPLQAPADAPAGWRLPREHDALDPTVPEVRRKVAEDIARLRQWGYELIKHDYTTYDVFGRWGFRMGASLTDDGWTFAAGSAQTTAEVLNELYRTIRDAAGDSLVIGCNTVSHLSAGRFEICRIGDDTSGTEWARTRKMGVNSLAFRGAQHGAFYVADADCVGVTGAVPWEFNRQWLDLLARSGTMLFVSIDPAALGADQRRDLRAALALAATRQPLAEPLDWQRTVYPAQWRLMGREQRFDWVGADGAGPP